MQPYPSDDHFIKIYRTHASAYHGMIEQEDVNGTILSAIQSILPLKGKRLFDLGSGSGRLPLLFAGQGAHVTALDLHHAMLREQQRQQTKTGQAWPLIQADMRWLPLPAATFDAAFAGWALGHTCGWSPQSWQVEIDQMLDEMVRVTKPGGHLVIFETLGTGVETPAPPTPELNSFYDLLENRYGFHKRILQTDYQFTSVQDAVANTRFFFGDALADKILLNQWSRLPEFTGIWHKQVHK